MVRAVVELEPVGADDRLGTLNHVTPAKRVAAAGLVQEGVSVSCGWDIRTGRQPGATVENQRYMLSTGLGLADEGRKNLFGGGRAGGAQEFIGMVFHGLDVTHLDSLAHIFWDGKLYGGAPASTVSNRQGALMHDVLAVAQGVTTRGVLLDIPRFAAWTCSPPTTTFILRTSRPPSGLPASASGPATWC